MDTTTVKPIYRGTRIVWLLFSIVEVILLIRFLLKLIGASTAAPFTTFIYGLSAPFMAPFRALVPSAAFYRGVFEWNSLIAVLVWWIVAEIIVKLLLVHKPITTYEAHQSLNAQDSDI
jgi:uncharacterized protein YggT (Ycf19 family)